MTAIFVVAAETFWGAKNAHGVIKKVIANRRGKNFHKPTFCFIL
jgi:hypothetical protein